VSQRLPGLPVTLCRLLHQSDQLVLEVLMHQQVLYYRWHPVDQLRPVDLVLLRVLIDHYHQEHPEHRTVLVVQRIQQLPQDQFRH